MPWLSEFVLFYLFYCLLVREGIFIFSTGLFHFYYGVAGEVKCLVRVGSGELRGSCRENTAEQFYCLYTQCFCSDAFFFYCFTTKGLGRAGVGLRSVSLGRFALLVNMTDLPSLMATTAICHAVSGITTMAIGYPRNATPQLPGLI